MSKLTERTFWGDTLEPWPIDVVAKMGIPADDATYLSSVGLPTRIDWNLEVKRPHKGSDVEACEGLPVLAFDGPVPLCVEANGSVVAIEGTRARRVNSNVRRFGAFLMLYQDCRLRVRGLDDEDANLLIDATQSEMRVRDSDAIAEAEGYWRVVLEQMRAGLL